MTNVSGEKQKRERCFRIVPVLGLIRPENRAVIRQDLEYAALVLTEHNALW
jgi:hypothetical protein